MMSRSLKETGDVYLKAQSRILARSALEYELFKISGHEFNASSCYTGQNYNLQASLSIPIDVNTTVRYIGNGFPNACALANTGIVTNDSNGTAIIDIVISYTDPSTGEQVRFHRRTIQKP